MMKTDPLYTIFEQHLFNFQDENADRSTFIDGVIQDYLTQLRILGLSVPQEWENQIVEELFFQVNTMLVKKIYGCQNINDYTANVSTEVKKKANRRYQTLRTQVSQKKSA